MKIVLRVAGYVLCEDECGSEDCDYVRGVR